MRRSMVFLALITIMVPVLVNLTAAGNEPVPLTLDKECVFFGRILGSHTMMYSKGSITEPVYEPGSELPTMVQIQGFEVLNTATGEWHPLTLSEEGYFCANVGKGRYDLRGRGRYGRPYTIHSFNVPGGMAVNLGSFWVEACDPTVVSREGWYSYMNEAGWQEYRRGSGSISMRLEHITSDEAYEDCESWFAQCHEEAYDQFAAVIARR